MSERQTAVPHLMHIHPQGELLGKWKNLTIFCVLYLLLPPFYGHYAGQPEPALAGTPSEELKDFVGAVLLPTCPC